MLVGSNFARTDPAWTNPANALPIVVLQLHVYATRRCVESGRGDVMRGVGVHGTHLSAWALESSTKVVIVARTVSISLASSSSGVAA